MWSSTRCAAEAALRALALAAPLSLGLTTAALANPNVGAEPAANLRAASVSHPQLAGSRLQGEAGLRFFGLPVYHARLWTLPDFRADRVATEPLVLELEYQRDFKGRAIAERSLKEMRRAQGLSEPQAQRWLAQMERIFPDVQSGDKISGVFLPEQGAAFWYNGRPMGRVDDVEFGRRFFGIWLAPTTSEPDMRLALLGLADPGRR